MRVIILADFAEPSGGAQSVALDSALALAARGAEVVYVQGVAGPVDPQLAQVGVTCRSLGLSDIWARAPIEAAVTGIWDVQAARRLRATLADLVTPGTVLHLHQWTRAMSPSVLRVLLRAGAPLAITLHDYFAACPNGLYYRFDRHEPCTLTPLSAGCVAAACDPRSRAHKAIRVLRSLATRATLAQARCEVIHVSDRGREVIGRFLPPGLRQHRIDNPVEVERRPPAEIPDGATAYAYVGRLTREKGADLVAEAAALAGVPVLFIGEGPAEADIRHLNPGADVLGWRPRGEVADLLRTRARALVAPSRWYETGPLTVYEALAAGLPVVASSRSGAAEKVVHGETGLVVEPEAGALADAFRQLSDVAEARRMGRAAHDRYWAAPLDGAAHATRLVELYREMLARA